MREKWPSLGKSTPMGGPKCQMVISETAHMNDIMWTEHVIFCNKYLYTYMHTRITSGKKRPRI